MADRSDRLNQLAAALARAQAELGPVPADATGSVDDGIGDRTYRYATLAGVWEAVRATLPQHGLSVVQTCEAGRPDEVRLVTMLLHSSGQWISGTTVLPLLERTPQGLGSALTYARRYGLTAMVGLCVDRDDDGVVAGRPGEPGLTPGDQSGPTNGSPVRSVPWWKAPCNEANSAHLRAFARAYARATGATSVHRDDVRRDFGIEGTLVDYFGDTPLGEIVARARAERSARATAEMPAEHASTEPEAEAA